MQMRVFYDATTLRVVGIENRETFTAANIPPQFASYASVVADIGGASGYFEDQIWRNGQLENSPPPERADFNNLYWTLHDPSRNTDAQFLTALRTAYKYRK